jgi:hypothetical protein
MTGASIEPNAAITVVRNSFIDVLLTAYSLVLQKTVPLGFLDHP